MNYNNTAAKGARKRTFFLLYFCTIIVVVVICSAFIMSPPGITKSGNEITRSLPANIPAVNIPAIDVTSGKLKVEIEDLQGKLKEKEEKILLLEEQLKIVSEATPKVVKAGKKEEDEIKFLKWALSSQSNDLAQMKKQNVKLKAQVIDLKKYLN